MASQPQRSEIGGRQMNTEKLVYLKDLEALLAVERSNPDCDNCDLEAIWLQNGCHPEFSTYVKYLTGGTLQLVWPECHQVTASIAVRAEPRKTASSGTTDNAH
jgi:hypothetical protein